MVSSVPRAATALIALGLRDDPRPKEIALATARRRMTRLTLAVDGRRCSASGWLSCGERDFELPGQARAVATERATR